MSNDNSPTDAPSQSSPQTSTDPTQNVVKLIIVVGFHHKKGATIEYSYPNDLYTNEELLQRYKFLPHLALPDGAHKYEEDTTFLTFPNGEYAVAQYRQIARADLKQVGEDVTRNTVQKAVVAICQHLPTSQSYLFGPISQKLAAISKAYFEERDFSHTDVLQNLYTQLQQNSRALSSDSVFLGIKTRQAVLLLRHDILRLFKLLLLEKRIIVYGSGTRRTGNVILAMLSLFPRLLESGILKYNDDAEAQVEPAISATISRSHSQSSPAQQAAANDSPASSQKKTGFVSPIIPHEFENSNTGVREQSNEFDKPAPKRQFLAVKPAGVDFNGFGNPLGIFTHGNFCYPYSCLAQLEKLESTESTRTGFLIGSSNDLIKTRWKQFADVFVDLDNSSFTIKSNILKHQVDLSSADLRFADEIVQKVEQAGTDASVEVVDWEGGDEWIRQKFESYLNAFLSVTRYDGNPQLVDDFNGNFLQSWKSNTVNSSLWYILDPPHIEKIQPLHPCHQENLNAGNLLASPTDALEYTQSMLSRELNDATLKMRYALKTTSSGRKVSAAAADVGVLATGTLKNAASFTEKTLGNLAAATSGVLEHASTTIPASASTNFDAMKNVVTPEMMDNTKQAIGQAGGYVGSVLSSAGGESKKWLSSGYSFLSSKWGGSQDAGTPVEKVEVDKISRSTTPDGTIEPGNSL